MPFLTRLLSLLLVLAACATPALAAPPRGYVSRADALLRQRVSENRFSGVVIVADHGRVVLRRAYGLANREWKTPVTLTTQFRIGSTTKTFTAAAVLQLVEAGKVRLEAPAALYLTDMPPAWAAVTVRQLLDHSSGIPDYVQVNGFIRGPGRLDLSPAELIGLVRNQPLAFAPGSGFVYSNTDYVLLGQLIERASDQPYAAYIQAHLLTPLGLSHTAADDARAVVSERASGYWNDGGVIRNARVMTVAVTWAAGDLRSNADDLLAWDRALHGGNLLSESSLAQMFRDDGHGYGLGSFVEMREGHRLWDHGGNLPGFASAFEHYPDDGLSVIVLSNIEGHDAEALARDLAGLWFGWTLKVH